MMNFLDERLPDRFWEKVVPIPFAGCWLWTGARVWNDYGAFRFDGKTQYAHRVSFEAVHGGVESGHDVDHLCRVRCCVNPAHLESVTHRENLRRGSQGAAWGSETHCRHGHEYTKTNIAPRAARAGGRACRECNRLKAQKCRAGGVS